MAEALRGEEFQRATGVSRETLARLEVYAALLVKWQPTINLVGRSTLDDVWRRHFLDSAQLLPLLPEGARVLVDLGSGAGFPGLVLAILGMPAGGTPAGLLTETHLIESDQRKATFLREVARATGAPVQVHARRIDAVPAFAADAVTSRALAPLTDLLAWAAPFIGTKGVCVFPKGRQVEDELTGAAKGWNMRVERFDSQTDPTGTILRVSNLIRA